MTDINLMPPMIIKNCLPFNITVSFQDSSKHKQSVLFKKKESRNLFCFTMSQNIIVELEIEGFKPCKAKIFNLDNYKQIEDTIELEDLEGRKT